MRIDALPFFPLRPNRVHETGGPLAPVFAAICAAESQGTVFWLRERWLIDDLNPHGLSPFFDPRRLLIGRTANQADTLACTEEALRSGAVALAVAELTRPVTLTQGRRLQLAAEAGATLGLCLIPEGGGSNAAETRWHVAGRYDASDSTLMDWRLTKNKSGTIGAWNVRWDAQTRRLDVVSPAAQRPGSEVTSR